MSEFMNGYLTLKEKNKLDLLIIIKNRLVALLNNYEHSNSDAYKQFLANRVLGIQFNKEIQRAYVDINKEVKYPLPKLWRKELEYFSFKSDTFSNTIRWKVFLVKWYVYGLYTIIIELKRFFTNPYKLIKDFDYVFFLNLSDNNLPVNSKEFTNNNIINYYLTKTYGDIVSRIGHDVNEKKSYQFKNAQIFSLDSPVPNISSLYNLIKFLVKVNIRILKSIIYFIKEEDVEILLLREKILSDVFLLERSKCAKKYFFHNSTHLQRPLWTYIAEKSGSDIIFYFYSINHYPITTFENPNFIRNHFWNLVTWPIIWTWNQKSKDDLSQIIKNSTSIEIVDPIWFSSSTKYDFKKYDKSNTIALFDIPVYKDYHYYVLGNTVDYYGFETSKKFLIDVLSIADELNLNVIFKQKRFSNLLDKKYLNLIEDLKEKYQNFKEIPTEIDAFHVIENVSRVISMPFTSTSIIATNKGIDTTFYDSTNTLIPNQKASYGVSLISSKEKLKEWLTK